MIGRDDFISVRIFFFCFTILFNRTSKKFPVVTSLKKQKIWIKFFQKMNEFPMPENDNFLNVVSENDQLLSNLLLSSSQIANELSNNDYPFNSIEVSTFIATQTPTKTTAASPNSKKNAHQTSLTPLSDEASTVWSFLSELFVLVRKTTLSSRKRVIWKPWKKIATRCSAKPIG